MSKLNGRKVIMSRAPMTTPITARIRVIEDNHPLADVIEEDTAYIGPIGMVPDAGDNDGDTRAICDAEDSNLKVIDLEAVVDNVIARTGEDQLTPGGSYWGDHYNIASATSVKKKRGLSKKNLSLDLCDENLSNANTRKSLPGMLEASTLMFTEAVGWVHRLFLTADIYLSMVWCLEESLKEMFPNWTPVDFTKNKNLILILAEIYEVPLGGLSWEAYDVIFGHLIPVIQAGLDVNPDPAYIGTFDGLLTEAGMNGDAASDVIFAADKTFRCRKLGKGAADLSSQEKANLFNNPETFLELCAEIAALISKGQMDLKNSHHQAMCALVIDWLDINDPSGVLVDKSLTLLQISEFFHTVMAAALGDEPEIDLDYFC